MAPALSFVARARCFCAFRRLELAQLPAAGAARAGLPTLAPLNPAGDAYLIGCARRIIGLEGTAIVLHHPTQSDCTMVSTTVIAEPTQLTSPTMSDLTKTNSALPPVIRIPKTTLSNEGADGSDDDDSGSGTAVITRTKPKVKRPNLYRVLLLNDDYTPMEFVVHVLERFFRKTRDEASQIMLHVHQNGVGECGVYTYEVAETKVTQVMDFARQNQHPLQCVMEKK
jgi:ATP-dependent Clp protease adaptor protein ClpS